MRRFTGACQRSVKGLPRLLSQCRPDRQGRDPQDSFRSRSGSAARSIGSSVRVGGPEVTHSRRWGTTSPTLRLVNVPLLLSSGSVMTVRPRGAREVPRLQWDLQRLNIGEIEGRHP